MFYQVFERDSFLTTTPRIAFLKRKVLLAWDAGDDDRGYLPRIVYFGLRVTGYCEIQTDEKTVDSGRTKKVKSAIHVKKLCF